MKERKSKNIAGLALLALVFGGAIPESIFDTAGQHGLALAVMLARFIIAIGAVIWLLRD